MRPRIRPWTRRRAIARAASAVNATAPAAMAEEAAALGARLVHYSTDYVFDGTKTTPYVEEDRNRSSEYVRSIEACRRTGNCGGGRRIHHIPYELGIQQSRREFFEDHASFAHGAAGTPHRSRTSMARRPRRTRFAEATVRILNDAGPGKLGNGVYHMTAGGATSWYGFAKAIFASAPERRRHPSCPLGSAEYPTPASRPANSVLSNEKFAANFGFRLPEWEQQLDAVMAARATASEPEIHAGTYTNLAEVKLLAPRVFADSRGFFLESYNQRTFAELGNS